MAHWRYVEKKAIENCYSLICHAFWKLYTPSKPELCCIISLAWLPLCTIPHSSVQNKRSSEMTKIPAG